MPPSPPKPPAPPAGPGDYEQAKRSFLAKIVPSETRKRLPTWSQLYTAAKDDLHPLRALERELVGKRELKADESLYKLARLTRGVYGMAQQMVENATFSFAGKKNNGKALKAILHPVRNDLDGFRAYMAARRVAELNRRGIASGFDPRQAEAIIRHGHGTYAKPFAELVAYQRRVLNYLRDSGVISADAYEAMVEANKDYVPFFRLMGGEFDGPSTGGRNLKVRDPIKGIRGSERAVIDPIESIVKNTYLYVALAEKNRALQALDTLAAMAPKGEEFVGKPKRKAHPVTVTEPELAKFLDEHGLDASLAEPFTIFRPNAFRPGPDQIAFFRDGKREVRQVSPDVAEAVNALDREQFNWLIRALSAPARLLRLGATQAPEFIVRNPIRDQFEAFVNTGGKYVPVYDMLWGLGSIFRHGKWYQEWLKNGGANAALVSLDRKYIEREVMKLSDPTALGRLKNVVRSPLDFLRMMSELSENATRVGLYRRMAKGNRWSSGVSPAEAALQSREGTLDFARIGAQMRAANAIVPFLNAQLEGTDRNLRAFKEHPFASTVAAMAAITLPSILLWFANHDDDRYKELPRWQKDLFWIVLTDKWVNVTPEQAEHLPDGDKRLVGDQWQRNDGIIWRIPKPFTLGLLFGSAPERVLDALYDHKPDAFKHLSKAFVDAIAPNVIPQAALPLVEQFANRSLFLDRPIVPNYLKDVLPRYQHQPYTSESAKLLGKALDKLGMGESSFASPLVIDNYIRAWSGGLGQYAVALADKALVASGAAEPIVQPTMTAADIPILKAFVARYPSTSAQSIQDFYDTYDEHKRVARTVKYLAKKGDAEEAQAVADSDDTELVEKVHEALGNLMRVVRDIWFDNSLDPDEKRRLIDVAYLQAIEFAKQGNAAFRATAKAGAKRVRALEAVQ